MRRNQDMPSLSTKSKSAFTSAWLHLDRTGYPLYVLAAIYPIVVSWAILIAFTILFVGPHYAEIVRINCHGKSVTTEWFPSMSSVIGDLKYARLAFRFLIIWATPAKFISALGYRYLYSSLNRKGIAATVGGGDPPLRLTWRIVLSDSLVLLELARCIAAAGWIQVSSAEHMILHQFSFILYVLLTLIVSCLMVILESRIVVPITEPFLTTQASTSTTLSPESDIRPTQKSHTIKLCAVATMFFELLLMANFFIKHTVKCTPSSYSAFNLTEVLFAMTMIVFESTVILDFRNLRLRFEPASVRIGNLKGV